MAYKYDIFISYRRHPLTRSWIENHFLPIIELHIFNEIGRQPNIFIDSQLEYGTTWPNELGHALSASRTIIPLWTKTYLDSKWCACEIDYMLRRENRFGFRSPENPRGLVFPTVIHDGETMPVNLTTIQKIEIQDCYNVKMSPHSSKAETLADKLYPLGTAIATAIAEAPDWQNDWYIEAVNNFVTQLQNNHLSYQSSPPKFQN